MVAPSYLRSFQALELAVRTGSLRSAAEALGITAAAAGQRVKALEDYLGVDLLVRGRSGLQPTASLGPALPHLIAAFRELETAAELLDLQRCHQIHIVADADLIDLWLAPRLAAFRADHPNMDFRLEAEGDAGSRADARAPDCLIGFGPPRPDADTLFGDVMAPVCSPDIAERLARAGGPGRLEGFPLLHVDVYRQDASAPDWPRWMAAQGLVRTAPDRGLRFRRLALALEALRADAGLALCGTILLCELIEDGRLGLPFSMAAGAPTTHVFQTRFRGEALVRPQVRRFRDWLLTEAARTARRFAALVAAEGGADPRPSLHL